MIHYLCMSDNVNPMRKHLNAWGWPLRPHVRICCYDGEASAEQIGEGVVIFSDVDRMPAAMMERAAALWQTLAARGDKLRLLNRPGVSLGRVALLKQLHEAGLNDFAVYRPDEPRQNIRYPVFVRHAVEHLGTFTELIHDEAALEAALAELVKQGRRLEDLLIVEFLDTGEAGIYRKYSAMKVGDKIIPHHIFFQEGDDWHVKRQGPSLYSAAVIEEERRFHEEHPHHDQLRKIFNLAQIDYGRIDYAVRNGRVQTWEINPNPTVLVALRRYRRSQLPTRRRFAAAFNRALLELDGHDERLLRRINGNPPLWMRWQARLQRAIQRTDL